jgi:hypothetical protein
MDWSIEHRAWGRGHREIISNFGLRIANCEFQNQQKTEDKRKSEFRIRYSAFVFFFPDT